MPLTELIAQDVPPFVEAFGRLHPAAVHLPVGLVVGAFLAEAFRALQRRPEASPFTPTALLLAALGGLLAGATGWVFALDHGSGNDLFWHRWLGVASTAGCFGVAWLAARAARPDGADLVGSMRGALVALTILVAWSGHLGANMVWGPGFVWEPIVDSPGGGGAPDAGDADGSGDAAPGAATGSDASGADASGGEGDPTMLAKLAFYREQVLPIFESRCYECHGNGKRKGGLRMDVRDSVVSRDDDGLWIVQPGKPADSVMITRVMLPPVDDLAMPPEGDRLAAAQVDAIRKWIEDGAVMPESAAASGGEVRAGGGSEDEAAIAGRGTRDRARRAGAADGAAAEGGRARRPLAEQLPPLSDEEIAAATLLRSKGIHVAPIAQGASTFTVSVPGGPAVGDIDLAQVYPMAARVEELSFARSALTDAGAMAMPSMPNARVVRLDGTQLTDAGIIAVLSRTLDAETVNLVNTPATDAVFAMLAKLPHLERAYLFGSNVSAQGVAEFRKARPGVEIVLGEQNAP